MSRYEEWVQAYARQADADLKAFESCRDLRLDQMTECHRLLLLQMSCEKLCKAHLIQGGLSPESARLSHAYIAGPLPGILRAQIVLVGRNLGNTHWLMTQIKHLASEIEILNPSVRRDGRRPDNCEYPWEVQGEVLSPLDQTFPTTQLVAAKGLTTFRKLLRLAINSILTQALSWALLSRILVQRS